MISSRAFIHVCLLLKIPCAMFMADQQCTGVSCACPNLSERRIILICTDQRACFALLKGGGKKLELLVHVVSVAPHLDRKAAQDACNAIMDGGMHAKSAASIDMATSDYLNAVFPGTVARRLDMAPTDLLPARHRHGCTCWTML